MHGSFNSLARVAAVLDGQDYNASTLDRIGDDEGRARNDQFPDIRNPAALPDMGNAASC